MVSGGLRGDGGTGKRTKKGQRRLEGLEQVEWRVEVAVLFLRCSLNLSGFTIIADSPSFFY